MLPLLARLCMSRATPTPAGVCPARRAQPPTPSVRFLAALIEGPSQTCLCCESNNEGEATRTRPEEDPKAGGRPEGTGAAGQGVRGARPKEVQHRRAQVAQYDGTVHVKTALPPRPRSQGRQILRAKGVKKRPKKKQTRERRELVPGPWQSPGRIQRAWQGHTSRHQAARHRGALSRETIASFLRSINYYSYAGR